MAPVASTVAKLAKPDAKKKSAKVRSDVLLDMIKEHPVSYYKRHLKFKDIKYKDNVWTKQGENLEGTSGMDYFHFTKVACVKVKNPFLQIYDSTERPDRTHCIH